MHIYILFDTFCCKSTDYKCCKASWGLLVNFFKILIFFPPSKLKFAALMFEGPALQIQALSWLYKKIKKTKMAMA